MELASFEILTFFGTGVVIWPTSIWCLNFLKLSVNFEEILELECSDCNCGAQIAILELESSDCSSGAGMLSWLCSWNAQIASCGAGLLRLQFWSWNAQLAILQLECPDCNFGAQIAILELECLDCSSAAGTLRLLFWSWNAQIAILELECSDCNCGAEMLRLQF